MKETFVINISKVWNIVSKLVYRIVFTLYVHNMMLNGHGKWLTM